MHAGQLPGSRARGGAGHSAHACWRRAVLVGAGVRVSGQEARASSSRGEDRAKVKGQALAATRDFPRDVIKILPSIL